MTTPAIVDRRVLLDGFEQARGRFVAAVDDVEGRSAYFALFEALQWAVALDELIAKSDAARWKWRDAVQDGDVVRGLRYARNRAHHQWADALHLQGALYPSTTLYPSTSLFPGASGWRWRPLADLPPADKPEPSGEAAYRSYLAEEPPGPTLDTLSRIFATVV